MRLITWTWARYNDGKLIGLWLYHNNRMWASIMIGHDDTGLRIGWIVWTENVDNFMCRSSAEAVTILRHEWAKVLAKKFAGIE